MNFILIIWTISSFALGIVFLIDNYNFFEEAKSALKKFNIFGKIIAYIYFIPFLIVYLPIRALIILMTWHPNSKN